MGKEKAKEEGRARGKKAAGRQKGKGSEEKNYLHTHASTHTQTHTLNVARLTAQWVVSVFTENSTLAVLLSVYRKKNSEKLIGTLLLTAHDTYVVEQLSC